MEPPPPIDAETRTIIDKLAEFVARNGFEFENITKKKQLTNPKFAFLYGGEHYNYYKHRVCMEQRLLGQQYQQPAQCPSNLVHLMNNPMNQLLNMDTNGLGMDGNRNNTSCPPPPIPPNVGPPPPGNPSVLAMQIESLNGQAATLREQIMQSEQNLQAQHTALMQQQQKAIDEMLPNTQKEYLQKSAQEESIDLAALDQVLQPIIDSCTKDNISAGKNWILQVSTSGKRAKIVLQHLLQKSLDFTDKFTSKLHLVYLVNDVLHHCARKSAEEVKHELENIVIPMFCSAQLIATDAEGLKLAKLLTLWESKGNFFDACVISKLRSPESSLQEYRTNLEATHSSAVTALKQTTKATLDNYEQQHQVFVKHATQQIATWEVQKKGLEQQLATLNQLLLSPPPTVFMANNNNNSLPPVATAINDQSQSVQQGNNMMMHPQMDNHHLMPPGMMMMANNNNNNNSHDGYLQGPPPPPTPPSNSNNPNFFIPDLSRPPPGFGAPGGAGGGPPMQDTPPPPQQQQQQQQLLPPPIETPPATPYFNLPAGLMAPFIRLEDCNYKPLDPSLIVLPPPTPPSERLLVAVESFYALPSHERPRDGDGWEKLALYEYYKVKNQARRQKEEAVQRGQRERSRSPSPIVIEARVKRVAKRRYRSVSRSPERGTEQQPAVGVVKVVTPSVSLVEDVGVMEERGGGGGGGRSRSRESGGGGGVRGGGSRYSREERRSDSPADVSSRSSSRERPERTSRGRPRDISPPSTPGIGFKQTTGSNNGSNNSIDQSNKGHQMLLKMGWAGAGTGLGVSGQGIDKPIDGGAVRDRQDIYKGVGMNMNDPYENFRKNKGAAFITRMKARADDKV